MNSNIPPSDENNGRTDGQPPRSPQGGEIGSENPYFARQQQTADPDLDANEPVLRSSDLQKLNRKALLFLGGIALLLIVAVFWLISGNDSKEPPPKPRQEAVVAPALPQTAAPLPTQPAEPVPLAQEQNLPPLPPMPTDNEIRTAPVAQDRGPSLLDRRMAGLQDSAPAGGGQPGLGGMLPPGGQQQPGADQEEVTSAKPIANPDGLLVRGTYIRCVLETRIISDFAGYTSCIITEPVYSINGRRLLLPKGSKLLGKYDSVEPTGPRMEVVWDRITTPTGIDVTLMGPGIDNLGSAGHPGKYNAHWASRISSALMISMLSDAFKWAAAEHGPETTTVGLNSGLVTEQPYESNTARTVQRMADQALERSGRRPATVTINQGTVVNVYVAKDVDFTAVLSR